MSAMVARRSFVPTTEPFSDVELAATKKDAERCQYQRGAQGRWSRHFLRLYENYESMRIEAEAAHYDAMERDDG